MLHLNGMCLLYLKIGISTCGYLILGSSKDIPDEHMFWFLSESVNAEHGFYFAFSTN